MYSSSRSAGTVRRTSSLCSVNTRIAYARSANRPWKVPSQLVASHIARNCFIDGGVGWLVAFQMVRSALSYHCSGSRTVRITLASGYFATNSRQK